MGVKIIQNPTLWIGSLREAQYSYDRNELLDSGAEIIWILFISPVCQTGNNFARNPELAKGCFSAKIRYSKRLRLFSSSCWIRVYTTVFMTLSVSLPTEWRWFQEKRFKWRNCWKYHPTMENLVKYNAYEKP